MGPSEEGEGLLEEKRARPEGRGRHLALTLGPVLNRTQELAQKLSTEIRSAAGLVVTRQGLGAFVASDVRRRPFRIDPAELRSGNDVVQILELRMSLEIEASGLAAERRSEKDLTQIAAALKAIDAEIERGGDAVNADFAFHLAIFRASRNRFFPQFLEFLGNFIIPRQIVNVQSDSEAQRLQFLRRIQTEHMAIYEAIRDRNVTAAHRAARRHLRGALKRYHEISSRASVRQGAGKSL